MDSLDKLYFKLNRELDSISTKTSDEEMIASFKRVSHLIDELNIAGQVLSSTNKEKLLNPILVKLATNKELYYEYVEPLTYMSYEKYMSGITLLSDEDIFNYLRDNIKYTSHNNLIESIWIDKFIANHIDKKICPSILGCIFSKNNDEFRVFCDALLKKKAADYSITITSNPMTLIEYLKRTKATRKIGVVLKRTNEYFKCAGNCSSDNSININLTTIKLSKMLSSNKNIDYEILRVIYHELAHAKIESAVRLQSPFYSTNIYAHEKERLFASNNRDYYYKYHDYFESEITAEISGYTDLIKDLQEYECKNFWDYKRESQEKITRHSLYRTTKEYYEIEDKFDELLIKHPDYIRANKWLRSEYNNDGKRKEISDLLEVKNDYIQSLDKSIDIEKRFCIKNNVTLDYLNSYKLLNEADNLFYGMIYRKIREYSIQEFDEFSSNCSTEILSEIKSAIEYEQDALFTKQDMLDENSLQVSDFCDNKAYINSLLAKNLEYKNIVSKHIKQKRR